VGRVVTGQEGPDQLRALSLVVARQREELARLRRAARTTALVEQAKGVVAERLGCTPEQAFDHLVRLTRPGEQRLVDVCAEIVGVPAPPAGSPEPVDSAVFGRTGHLRPARPAEPEVDDTAHLAALAALSGATDPAELARVLREEALSGGGTVLVYTAEPGGGLHLEAAANAPTRVLLGWRQVPPHVPTPPATCASTGETLWLPDLADARARYGVLVGDPEPLWPSRAWVPFLDGDRVAGVVGLLFDEPREFGPADRARLTSLVRGTGRRLLAMLATGPDGRPRTWTLWVQQVLDALPGCVALLTPVRGADGTVVDHRVEAVSPDATDPAGRTRSELVGSSIVGTHPELVGTELWNAYQRVLATGNREVVGPVEHVEVRAGESRSWTSTVTVGPFGDALLVTWQTHEAPRERDRLGQVERLGNLGWGRWNLVTGESSWSDQVYAILGRDPALGPLLLDEVPSVVVPDDLPIAANAMSRLLRTGEPVDAEFRVDAGGRERHVRIVAEPTLDADGRPVAFDGIVQDVTAARRAQRQMLTLHQQVRRHRDEFTREHQVATHLRDAVLPLPAEPLDLPGLRVTVRYLAAERWADVGGDWYQALELPGGDVLLAVGDVAGHGLATASSMAKLRYALTGAALADPDPAGVLRCLNTLLVGGADVTLASCVVARFDPRTRELVWAQAGHPAPLLVRDGDVRVLGRPRGMILGAVPGAPYDVLRTVLRQGDTLLLFTDGLVERRPDDPRAGDDLARLVDDVRVVAAGLDPAELPGGITSALVPATQLDDTCVLAATVFRSPV
jgi:serine phosphatase RsbU (regulator of sigma subunit)